MKNFIFGETLIANWFLKNPDGDPFDLRLFSCKLYYITSRGRSAAQSVIISGDGDYLSWTFEGGQQAFKGEYGLRLEIYTISGAHFCTIDYPDLFRLATLSSYGDSQNNNVLNQQGNSQILTVISTIQSKGSVSWGEIGGDIDNQPDIKEIKDKADANGEDIADIISMIPTAASSSNKFATKADVKTAESKLIVVHYVTGRNTLEEPISLSREISDGKHITLCVDGSYFYPLVWPDSDYHFAGLSVEEPGVIYDYVFDEDGVFVRTTEFYYSDDTNVVHLDRNETITGEKSFGDNLIIGSDEISYGGEDGFGWIKGWDNEAGEKISLEDWLNEHFVAKTQ